MRVKGYTLQQFLLGAALVFALAYNLAHASEIKGLVLEQGATGTRAEVLLDGPAEYTTLSLSGPDRLVVDLPASAAARNLRLPTDWRPAAPWQKRKPRPDPAPLNDQESLQPAPA